MPDDKEGSWDSYSRRLIDAAYYGQLEIVKDLVASGADVTTWRNCPVRYASQEGHLEVVEYLVALGADVTEYGDHAIRTAAENGHLDVVRFLASVGADVTAEDNYAIKEAVKIRRVDIVRFLVESGSDYLDCGIRELLNIEELPPDKDQMLLVLDMFVVNKE